MIVALILAQAEWLYFESRETAKPPRLVADGREFAAEADAILLSYRADRAFGGHPQLPVSVGDTNRALLRFNLAGLKSAKKAEIVLAVGVPPSTAPRVRVEVGLHRCSKPWDEEEVTWASQPAFDESPAATVRVEPRAGEVRVDATALVAAWLKDGNHGCVLKIGEPFESRLLRSLPFEKSVAAAIERARADGKLVLAIVRPEYGGEHFEHTLFAVALAHPDVRATVVARYIPVRVAVNPTAWFGRPGADPLTALGTSVADVKAPAIVLADAKGACVASLSSIGTFDYEMVLKFIARGATVPGATRGVALLRSGRFDEARKTLALARDDESAYWLACLDWRERRPKQAMDAWEALAAKDSPWALKARARATWPERLAMCESVVACSEPGRTTEVAATDEAKAVARAVDALLAMQLADGTWPLGEGDAYRASVTALSARALVSWAELLDAERAARSRDAVARADKWLRAYVETADPKTANGWDASYVLDYFVDRGARPMTAKAVALLLGGQCPNGAWSYDHRFGTSWKGGFGGWPKTDQGRVHSMNTGPALVALSRAKKAGADVDAKALERGVKALLAMREGPGAFTYTYPDPKCWEKRETSIGRASACEQALVELGAAPEADLAGALSEFMVRRAELRAPVKLTDGWVSRVGSGSYFYHFAYYHAARALSEHGGEAGQASLRLLRDDLLAVVEADGTWMDFAPVGKAYGTAMSLLVLRLAR